jgi:threonine dehydratase
MMPSGRTSSGVAQAFEDWEPPCTTVGVRRRKTKPMYEAFLAGYSSAMTRVQVVQHIPVPEQSLYCPQHGDLMPCLQHR